MKSKLLYILSLLALTNCIKNDVPYPYVVGEVLVFEVEGQKEVTINTDTRVITLVMDEDTDIRNARITKLEITEDATTDLSTDSPINLRETVNFNVKVYRDWEWKIKTTQPIEYIAKAEAQVGAIVVNEATKSAKIVFSKTQALTQVKINMLKLAPSFAVYSIDPTTITDLSAPVEIEVSYWDKKEVWTLSGEISTNDVSTGSADAWGTFAYLTGEILQGTTHTPEFEYRTTTAKSDWTTVTANSHEGVITAKITGLTPETTYIYRAKLGDEYGGEYRFTTEATPTIPNLNMDTWTLNDKTWYANDVAEDSFWATGNEGVNASLAGGHDSNTFPTDDAVKGKAVCINTIKVSVVGLAAGSIFTGDFKLVIYHAYKSAKFSRNYTGRPTKLSFYYKYLPKVIDAAPTNFADSLGKMDHCNVYMYLGDWENEASVFSVDLAKESFKENVIAFGEFKSNKEVSNYTKQTIDLQYFDMIRRPTKIIIVATSSSAGNDYVGGIGSTLYVDEMELEFD